MWWLGYLIAGAVGAAAAGIIIHGIITKSKLIQKLRSYGVREAVVTAVDRCSNVVSLKDLDDETEIEVTSNKGVSYEIYEDQYIIV